MVFKIIFYIFYVKETNTEKIKNNNILPTMNFLKDKKLSNIIYAQKKATEIVFEKKIFLFEVLK